MFKKDALQLVGRYKVEHWRKGKLIAEYDLINGITIEGKNHNLDVCFHEATACATWYLSLIDLVGWGTLDETDTYDDIDGEGNGWDEFKTYEYAASGTARVPFVEAAASGKSITNSATPGIFDILGSGTVKGIFLVSQPVGGSASPDTQGDHHEDGLLWSTALFSTGDVPVENTDQLKVTYTLSC